VEVAMMLLGETCTKKRKATWVVEIVPPTLQEIFANIQTCSRQNPDKKLLSRKRRSEASAENVIVPGQRLTRTPSLK
jgi:hypothetical protein